MKKHTKSALLSIVIFLVFFAAASLAIVRLTQYERGRDLGNWQLTLGMMADSRANAIDAWVEKQFAVLQELADNGSLQLYLQQLVQRPEANQSSEPAEISYLRNLLQVTAERNSFIDKGKTTGTINANVPWHANNGLVLLDYHQKIITGTPGIIGPGEDLQKALAAVLASGRRSFFELRLNANERAVVGFLVPVFPLQRRSSNPQPIGVLYGMKDAEETLFPLLTMRNAVTETDESYLVQSKGDLVFYLTPLADGTQALRKSLSVNAEDLVAAESVRQPGKFGKLRDYSGKRALFTSRKISGLPWIMIQKIDVTEALEESQSHQRILFLSLLFSLLLTSALIIAAWWYGSTLRERKASRELLEKTLSLEAQTDLLNAITDNITDSVCLIDGQNHFIFANQAFVDHLDSDAQSILGKSLSSVLGTQPAKILAKRANQARVDGEIVVREMVFELNDRPLNILATFVPMPTENDKRKESVLISLNDVTMVQEARRKKERFMGQIVSALMRAIDLHDPHSANHSANTAILSVALGRALAVTPEMLITIATAADLCNLGKLSVPRDVLTKQGRLSDDEQSLLHQETAYACDILSQIDFDGPVLETISQKHEFLDGSGYPQGLKGDDIPLSARIIAVANAFVAMVSPRAYRDRMPVRQVLDQLLEEADSRFDRHVVAALFHVAENNIDWQTWEKEQGIIVMKQNDCQD